MAHCANPARFFPTLKDIPLKSGILKGKVALVTGGGTGLGAGIAKTFAQLGAKVAIAARRLDVLEKTAQEIRTSTGGTCEAFQMDIKDPVKVAAAFDQIHSKFGETPNILINNAAGNFISATQRLSSNAFGTIIDIVAKGTMNVTVELGRRCIQQGRGASVLSITAPYARNGGPFVVPSAVAKAGVESMSRSLASEWAKFGIRLNVVAPGPIPTEGAFGRLTTASFEDVADATKHRILAGRVGAVEELANLVAFISSDYMSWMSGAVIDFDGGQQLISLGTTFGEFLHDYTDDDWQQAEATIRKRTGKSKI